MVAGSLISPEMRECLGDTAGEAHGSSARGAQTFTGILGPNGQRHRWARGATDCEEIVYGTIDLEAIIRQKIHHDVAGNYNRFDVLSLRLNRAPLAAISEMIPAGGGGCRRPGSRGEGPGGRAEGAPGLGLARGAESACRVAAGRAGRLALGGARGA